MLLRTAEPEDVMAVAQVHVRSWQAAYRGLIPDDYLDQLQPETMAARYDFATRDPREPRTILAVDEGAIIGFATTAPSREADLPDYGELWALYVDPPHWGRGFGNALMTHARGRMRELGFRHGVLWVLAGNSRAQRFYQIDGWTPDGLQRTATKRGIPLDEVRYRTSL